MPVKLVSAVVWESSIDAVKPIVCWIRLCFKDTTELHQVDAGVNY